MEDGEWRTKGGRWRMENGRCRVKDGGNPPAVNMCLQPLEVMLSGSKCIYSLPSVRREKERREGPENPMVGR